MQDKTNETQYNAQIHWTCWTIHRTTKHDHRLVLSKQWLVEMTNTLCLLFGDWNSILQGDGPSPLLDTLSLLPSKTVPRRFTIASISLKFSFQVPPCLIPKDDQQLIKVQWQHLCLSCNWPVCHLCQELKHLSQHLDLIQNNHVVMQIQCWVICRVWLEDDNGEDTDGRLIWAHHWNRQHIDHSQHRCYNFVHFYTI